MGYEWIDGYCMEKKGVTKDFQPAWNAARYFVGGKMFAMRGGDKYGKPIFTMKLDPQYGELLRQQFSDVVPGYYSNKVHWNSLYLDGCVPDETVRDMVDGAYQAAFKTLTKKAQREIEEM